MGKFGKKNEINLNPLSYNITILGESGIGKTTISKEMCEKLVGEEGYLHLDIGYEDGAGAIEGIITEKIESYSKMKEVVEDIVENKESDYPDLKVVIWDTFDEWISLVEKEVIRQHNKKHPDKKVDSINSAEGGFGKGQDKAMQLTIDLMASLKSVGVSNIIIGHVKRTDITDPVTQETYSKLTSDSTQKYFNAIKNKQHFVALAYIDREIVKEKTGRKNLVTKQDITVNKAVSESRVISFRDDTYSVDSKSRFANIVDKIPFDADAFIKAMQDAIMAEKTKNGKTVDEAKKEQKEREKKAEKEFKNNSKMAKKLKVDEDRNEEIKNKIQSIAMELQDKEILKKAMQDNDIESFKDVSEIPTEALENVLKAIS